MQLKDNLIIKFNLIIFLHKVKLNNKTQITAYYYQLKNIIVVCTPIL
jgi:hypothetical protein